MRKVFNVFTFIMAYLSGILGCVLLVTLPIPNEIVEKVGLFINLIYLIQGFLSYAFADIVFNHINRMKL